MTTEKGFDRLIAFSDAVVAIALTLLVLPLVDLPGEIADGTNLGDVLANAHNELIAFGVSFLVIWRLWTEHHQIFGHYRVADHVTMTMNFVWLATIVVLLFPTALLSTAISEHGAEPLYLGVLLVSSLMLIALTWRVRHHPELAERGDDAWATQGVDWATPAAMLLALILALIVPELGPWVMVLLAGPLLVGLLRNAFRRLTHRRRNDPRAAGGRANARR
jgi:uncharacterized membrane protein